MKLTLALILVLAVATTAAANISGYSMYRPQAVAVPQNAQKPVAQNWAPVIPRALTRYLLPVYQLFSYKQHLDWVRVPVCTPVTCVPITPPFNRGVSMGRLER